MIGFCPLASGSKGNCIYLGSKKTKILIDAGISCKAIAERLNALNVDIREIDAVLITHEHSDHIKGLLALSTKYQIPIFANSETAKTIYTLCGQHNLKFKIFSTGETFEYGDLEIHPFTIQHDAVDPVAFTIRLDGLKLGFCTDLGFATSLVTKHLMDCNYLYIEANHEPSMVHACARPTVYKQRVLSRQGHLSNRACAELIENVLHANLKHVHLAHLSAECNSPELALKTVENFVKNHGVEVSIAFQDTLSKSIIF